MIKPKLQNLVVSSNLVSHQFNEPQFLPEAGNTDLLARAIHDLRHYLVASLRKQAFKAETRNAIEHLHSLTDEHLRDIGITRMDISRAVRLGRGNF